MKKIIAIMLVLTMLFALVACGEKEPEETNAPETEAPAVDDGGSDPSAISGEVFNTGSFTALVPTGWKAFALDDIWSEDPGVTDPTKLQIVKDGTSEFDVLTKAYIQIDYFGPEKDMLVPASDWYEEVTELEPVVIGELTWNGFSAVSGGNPMTLLYAGEAGEPQYQAVLWCRDENIISATDADVIAILESLAPAE